jgi:hypothetical protein
VGRTPIFVPLLNITKYSNYTSINKSRWVQALDNPQFRKGRIGPFDLQVQIPPSPPPLLFLSSPNVGWPPVFRFVLSTYLSWTSTPIDNINNYQPHRQPGGHISNHRQATLWTTTLWTTTLGRHSLWTTFPLDDIPFRRHLLSTSPLDDIPSVRQHQHQATRGWVVFSWEFSGLGTSVPKSEIL